MIETYKRKEHQVKKNAKKRHGPTLSHEGLKGRPLKSTFRDERASEQQVKLKARYSSGPHAVRLTPSNMV